MITTNMATKDELIDLFIEGLKESFVSKYEEINSSKDIVNNYMKELNFKYKYKYNEFCTDFIKYSTMILKHLDTEEINNLDINVIVYEVLITMIKYKIFDNVKDEKERITLMMLHELKKYLMKKPNN